MEKWTIIKDYPNYEVSTIGRIKSTHYNKERILIPQNLTTPIAKANGILSTRLDYCLTFCTRSNALTAYYF